MKKIFSIIAVLALSAFAQFPSTPVKTIVVDKYFDAYDIEHMNDGQTSYLAFAQYVENDGSYIRILDMSTLTEEISFRCSSFDCWTDGVELYGYKNLFKSDGKWTFLSKRGEDFQVWHEGNVSAPFSNLSRNSTLSSPIVAGGKAYIILSTKTVIDIYLLRNDMPSTSAIWEKPSYGTAQKQINDKKFDQHFNVLGQQIPDVQFKDFQEIMKKTIVQPKGL